MVLIVNNLDYVSQIRELVSDYGIVCIPRYQNDDMDASYSGSCNMHITNECNEEKGEKMRRALDRLRSVTKNVSGTVILVNDARMPEISHISSTRCRSVC